MKRLPILHLLAGLVLGLCALAARASEEAARNILGQVAPGLVRVEIDLQYDRGEPPRGVLDHDMGSRQQSMHTLAELVAEERPLETSGFLIGADRVVAMDWTIHPRFVKTIWVRTATGEATATIEGFGRDQWAVFLKLNGPLAGAKPIEFGKGKAAHLATHYRYEGGMIRELLPFPGRVMETTAPAGLWRVIENQGLAVTTNGAALGVLLTRRIPLDDSWQKSPSDWVKVSKADYDARLAEVEKLAGGAFFRTRLSFRSPKQQPGMGRNRFRMDADGDADGAGTERDVVGVALTPNRVLVLSVLKPSTTARLQRIVLHPASGAPVGAKFVASLKDYGAFVVEPEKPLAQGVKATSKATSEYVERLVYRLDLSLQGENRVQYLHHARIGAVRIGRRLEGYPELPDIADSDTAFLLGQDLELVAMPVGAREKARASRFQGRFASEELTPARLLAAAVAELPATADPANVPVSEADENRLAWLGTELQPMTRELARANQVSDQTQDGESGAMVTYVHPESPAAKAGITAGAVLLRLRVPGEPVPVPVELEEDPFRGQPFPWDRLDDIREQVFERLPTPWAPVENAFTRALTDVGFGRKFTLEYIADGKVQQKEFEVTPGPTHYESASKYKAETIGVTVRDLTYDVRRYTQRKSDEPGVVISKIEPGSKASVAGLKPFEIITHVNDQAVADVKQFEQRIGAGGELKLSVKRMAKGRIVTIKPD